MSKLFKYRLFLLALIIAGCVMAYKNVVHPDGGAFGFVAGCSLAVSAMVGVFTELPRQLENS